MNMYFQNILVGALALSFVVGCAPDSGSKKAPAAGADASDTVQAQPEVVYTKLTEEQITRKCSVDEAKQLKLHMKNMISVDKNIDALKGENDELVITNAIEIVKTCDQLIQQLGDSSLGPCRTINNTIEEKLVVFDQYRMDQACQKADQYLVKHNARPTKETQQPPVEPGQPTPPPVVVNPKPPVSTTIRACTKEEFSKINEGMTAVNKAHQQIDKLGDSSKWKYDSAAISSAALATKACESLIAVRDQQGCEYKVEGVMKQYTGASLRTRCEKARTYFYEFVQNTKTLNFKNADLYLDVSGFGTKVFEVDYMNDIQGCRIENKSGSEINYSGKKLVLVKDSRGFEAKMMVLETAEGLLVQCYGLNIDGPFSKRQIVRVLEEEDTKMPLVYKLK